MKLVNYLTFRLTLSFLIILTVWSAIYFRLQMFEIYDDIDEGLSNLRQEFVLNANKSSDFTESMMRHNPLNIKVQEINFEEAVAITDTYTTSKIYFETESEEEEVRMLTTAFYSEPNDKYYKLQIFTSNVEAEDLSKNMFYLLMVLWIGLILTLIISNRIVLNKANRPFIELITRLKSFKLEDGKMIEIPETRIEEFDTLNKSVKKMLSNNLRAYSDQKEFIANASHELQTPIAIVMTKLELMLSEENLKENQLKEISDVLLILGRMKRINSNLLLLSKIQNRQFVDNKELNINDVLKSVLSSFEDLIEHRQLIVAIEENSIINFTMNEDLAFIMFNNLIKNAIIYNDERGRLTISILGNEIIIANDGKKLSSNKNIFERYVGSNENKHSLGLGLAIVKAITDYYSLEIKYEYIDMHIMKIGF